MFGGNNNNTGAVVLLENGIQFSDLSIQNTAYIVSNSAIRNRIINGAMKIDQRNAGVAQAIVAAAALAYTVDRHYSFCTGANITGQRITLANAQNRYRLTGLAAVQVIAVRDDDDNLTCRLAFTPAKSMQLNDSIRCPKPILVTAARPVRR